MKSESKSHLSLCRTLIPKGLQIRQSQFTQKIVITHKPLSNSAGRLGMWPIMQQCIGHYHNIPHAIKWLQVCIRQSISYHKFNFFYLTLVQWANQKCCYYVLLACRPTQASIFCTHFNRKPQPMPFTTDSIISFGTRRKYQVIMICSLM